MSEPFVAEIRTFPFNFAPRGWAFCDGQLMSLSQNTALFSLLGTIYGGDGRSNFALPDLQGRCAIHPSQGPGLSQRDLGEQGGSDTVTLTTSELPSHSHGTLNASTAAADLQSPDGAMLGVPREPLYNSGTPASALEADVLTGGDTPTPHNNLPPYLTLYSNIALQGVFPPRS